MESSDGRHHPVIGESLDFFTVSKSPRHNTRPTTSLTLTTTTTTTRLYRTTGLNMASQVAVNNDIATVALKASLRLMDASKIAIISEGDWLDSTRKLAVSLTFKRIELSIFYNTHAYLLQFQRAAMQVEAVTHDIELQVVALQAFENTVEPTGEIDEETLRSLLDIFHIIWPLYRECLKSPPPSTSAKMLACLRAMDNERSRTRSPEDMEGLQESDDIIGSRGEETDQ